MINLYARLVKGENARTEALADLLERVLGGDRERGTSRFADFVSRVLLADPNVEQERQEFMQGLRGVAAELSVNTQVQIDGGAMPDMVIFKRSDPVCIIEVKVDAPIGIGQLEGYGDWLAATAGERYRPALVFLTHSTQAPPTFRYPGVGPFGVELRSVASWNTVAEWFATLSAVEGHGDEVLRGLAGEFATFLKEDAMATLDDAAIARQYLARSERKLTQTVENMRMGFQFPEHWTPGVHLVKKSVGIWKYHYPEQDRKTRYLYYGLGFNPVDEDDEALFGFARYENALNDEPHRVLIGDGFYAFVCIYATAGDCARVPGFLVDRWYVPHDGELIQADDRPHANSTGWWHFSDEHRNRAGYAQIVPLQDVLDRDGRLGTTLTDWSHEALEKSVSLWNELFQQAF